MKLRKKVLTTVLAMSLMLTFCAVPAIAADYKAASTTASAQGHSYFKKAWKDYGCLKVGDKYYDFTYGYDTWITNEDYINDVYVQDKQSSTYYGKIENSDGITDVTNKKSDGKKTNKADVKHTSPTVTYYVYAR